MEGNGTDMVHALVAASMKCRPRHGERPCRNRRSPRADSVPDASVRDVTPSATIPLRTNVHDPNFTRSTFAIRSAPNKSVDCSAVATSFANCASR